MFQSLAQEHNLILRLTSLEVLPLTVVHSAAMETRRVHLVVAVEIVVPALMLHLLLLL